MRMGKGDAFYQSAVLFLEKPFIRLMPLDETQLWAAVRAYQSFGKGRHPASLNFGQIPFLLWLRRVSYLCCSRATISCRQVFGRRCSSRAEAQLAGVHSLYRR